MENGRIAVPSMEKGGLEGQRSGHFGHCDVFTLVDVEAGEIKGVTTISNQSHVQGGCMVPVNLLAEHNVNALKGAGIQAAGMVSDQGAEVLITGFCGPNAFKVLNAAKIKVASDAKGTVRDAINSFIQGKLAFVDQANVEGHW